MARLGTLAVNARFALALRAADAPLLALLRPWRVEVCIGDHTLWLRAERLDEAQWDHCRRLPGADRFTVLDDGQLLPVGAAAPRGYLPAGPWQPLADWLRVGLPPAGVPLSRPSTVRLALIRSSSEAEPSWLLTDADTWCRYAETAPQVRLARWSFAATAAGQVAVRGTPLPPLPGERLVDHGGIVVSAGWSWAPAVEPGVLRQVFSLAEGDSALWLADSSWHRIHEADWVQASRSAARLTLEELRRDRQ